MAFDAAVMIPRLKKRRVSVDYLARLAGLMRPDPARSRDSKLVAVSVARAQGEYSRADPLVCCRPIGRLGVGTQEPDEGVPGPEGTSTWGIRRIRARHNDFPEPKSPRRRQPRSLPLSRRRPPRGTPSLFLSFFTSIFY